MATARDYDEVHEQAVIFYRVYIKDLEQMLPQRVSPVAPEHFRSSYMSA